MKNIFKKLFNKKTDIQIEDEIEDEIIKENKQNEIKATAMVIQYIINNEDNPVPEIKFLCEFHSEIFPESNSIIWAPNKENTKLLPYKVIRYDFIEDPNSEFINMVYIVVEPALLNNIVKIEY